MKSKILIGCVSAVLIFSIVMISCSKSGSGYGSGSTTPPPASNAVSIVNMSFSPATLTVKAGTTVTWTNNDNMDHTVTADDASFDSGNMAMMGGKYSKVFSTAGTYTYHCTIHPTMKGTIVVK